VRWLIEQRRACNGATATVHLNAKKHTSKKERTMNKNIIAGKWEQVKGEAQKRWGMLTDDQIDQVEGDRKKLLGIIRESYGLAEEEAEEQLRDFENSCNKFLH